ncbi:MAG: FprA family A-type flavoprotein [Clostridiales bacterium]|jgi:flavorubredoxin|nr:FprA family A-type flavoprotein [Clostridiales bacterium]
MSYKKIKEGLYSVGILNPNLRVFDIVMKTDFGTSYNSYVIKDKKNALIETCHHRFFDEYVENIQSVIPLNDIDYIILNHTEPDHSGALERLAELCKNAKILCSRAASVYLKSIVNNDSIKFDVVKDGDILNLGSLDLKFIAAPFLHWPDTMFTYCEGLKTVFTCDFLGSHFCEPNVTDTRISYPEKYKTALKGYFNDIFSPFIPYVRAGLEKLESVEFDTACVSHGPVLTDRGFLECALESYKTWSKEKTRTALCLPVFYCSAYGYTRKLAETAVSEIKKLVKDAETSAYDIIEHNMEDLASVMNGSDGFMIGSPTLNRNAVSPVRELLAMIDVINGQKKPIGVFGSYGWSGEAVPSIVAELKSLRLQTIGEGLKINFYPSEDDLEKMRLYTKEFCGAFNR